MDNDSIAESLEQMAECNWILNNEPMPEDAKQVLLMAAMVLRIS